MAHQYFKTKYKEEVPCGTSCTVEERTLYVHHNESWDIVSFLDENGNYLLSFQDTVHPNLFEAMNSLSFPYKKEWFGELLDGIEMLNEEDRKIINKK
jgi:hypothetical protein